MAHQKGYIQYILSIITLILNTFACIVMIHLNASIQMVKLVSSLIFLMRPIFLRIYINRNYKIDRNIEVVGNPLPNKMSGLAMHVSSVVLEDTDTIILTLLSTYENVSIYSVYHLIVYGVKQILFSATSGFDSVLGQLWAKQELEKLSQFFSKIEWFIHTLTTLVFSCTAILILPFVSVYTEGIVDAEYIQPSFAMILTLATACHCLRLPYNKMIVAGGHFKETQRCYINAAIINLIVSSVTVYIWGLIGVALGTFIAMFYQTIWMASYVSKNFLNTSNETFIKQLMIDFITFGAIYITTKFIHLREINYISWFLMAFKVFVIAMANSIGINSFVYTEKIVEIWNYLKNKIVLHYH
jgi:O-antigen/teichoic acid export membrane protein